MRGPLARAGASLVQPLRSAAPWRAFSLGDTIPHKHDPQAEVEHHEAVADMANPEGHTGDDNAWGEVAVVAELPEFVRKRRLWRSAAQALIYPPSRAAAQQGNSLSPGGQRAAWKVAFGVQPKWENGLMGWTSSADSLEQAAEAHLLFQSRDAAAAFCRRNGWGYEVAEEKPTRKERPKRFLGYGDNFSVKRNGTPVGGLRSEAELSEAAAKKALKKDKK